MNNKVKELTDDEKRERDESRQRKAEQSKIRDGEFLENKKAREENYSKAQALFNKEKKKSKNYSYQIMFGIFGVVILYVIVTAFMNTSPPLKKVPVIDQVKIDEHNHHFDWKQGASSFFEGLTLADAKSILTTGFSNHNNLNKCFIDESITPPDHFNTKDSWPQCILPVMNTGKECNASYASALASTMAERNCITKGLTGAIPLSAQELLTCDVVNNGCKGGYLNNSLDYLRTKGIVTQECYPYKPEQTKCEGLCQTQTRAKLESYCLLMEEDNIKRDILKNGPVVSTMHVHVDFLTYKSGIYTKGDEVARFSGQHAIKIVGWGVESEGQNIGTKYWIVENNWGNDWGDNGFANIAVGQDLFFDQYAYGMKIKVENNVKDSAAKATQNISKEEDLNLDLEDSA